MGNRCFENHIRTESSDSHLRTDSDREINTLDPRYLRRLRQLCSSFTAPQALVQLDSKSRRPMVLESVCVVPLTPLDSCLNPPKFLNGAWTEVDCVSGETVSPAA